MADVQKAIGGGLFKLLRDMGDGTYAEVVAVGGGGDPDPVEIVNDTPIEISAAAIGDIDDAAYADPTGAADGTAIALLKGIYVQLAIIAANTAPEQP